MLSYLFVVSTACGGPAFDLDLYLEGEQRAGVLGASYANDVGPDATLLLRPQAEVAARTRRSRLALGYGLRVLVREAPGPASLLLMHAAQLTGQHDIVRWVRLEGSAAVTAGSMEFTGAEQAGVGPVGEAVESGLPRVATVDLVTTTADLRLSLRPSREWRWQIESHAAYLPSSGSDFPEQYWLEGAASGQRQMSRACAAGAVPSYRRLELIGRSTLDTISAPASLSCSIDRGALDVRGGVAAVLDHSGSAVDPRWFPVVGAAYRYLGIGSRCDVDVATDLWPQHDPLRGTVAARVALSVGGQCRFDVGVVRLQGRVSTPTPLEFASELVTPAQDTTSSARLSMVHSLGRDLDLEGGVRTSGRTSDEGGSVWDVGGFLAVRVAVPVTSRPSHDVAD